MSGSLLEKIRDIYRAFNRKKLAQEVVRVSDEETSEAELEENFQTFYQILERFESNRVSRLALELYAVAFQEKRIIALVDILPEPTKFTEFSRDKMSEALWFIQGKPVVQGKEYSGIELRQLLLRSRDVITNEQSLLYGDWVMIGKIMGEVIKHAGSDDNLLQSYDGCLTSIFEGLNGDPTPKAAQLELQGKYRLPDWTKMSSLWGWGENR